MHDAIGSKILLLYDATGSQILLLHDASGSQILPRMMQQGVNLAAGSQVKSSYKTPLALKETIIEKITYEDLYFPISMRIMC
jgi:hypothetical protein